MKTPSLDIRTPEGICFSQELAGPVTRFLALGVDFLVVMVIVKVLSYAVLFLALLTPGFAMAFQTLSYFAISIGYSIVCEWGWRGQTIGKRAFRLRVVDAEGLRIQFSQIVLRNLLRFIDALPVCYCVGGVACWFSPRCQRLGDVAANTVVVRIPKLAEPDLDQIMAGKFNSLRHYPHLVARLRQAVTPVEASLALQALLRRDEFEPPARIDLFSRLAAHFQDKVIFPAEALEGIADEQYIRNVVDVIYRARAN